MPVVNALTEQASINAVHMGVVLIVTLAFGLITPPYGLALLMASKFLDVKFSTALKASLPIYIIFFAAIAFTIRIGVNPHEAGEIATDTLLTSVVGEFAAVNSASTAFCRARGRPWPPSPAG